MQLENDLIIFNEQWIRAWFEKDYAAVELLMAEDYVYIAPNGRVLDRSTILSIIRSPSYTLYSGARSEIKVRLLGEGAALVRNK